MRETGSHLTYRRSIRLPGWDYRTPAFYFVTICTKDRETFFQDKVYDDIATLSLNRIPDQKHAKHVAIEESIVMPDHVHILLQFFDFAEQAVLENLSTDFQNAPAGSLGVVIGRYKSAVTSRINKLRDTIGDTVWQRGYYDRVIRDERELSAVRQYIIDNPIRWKEGKENLDKLLKKMNLRPG